MLSDLSVLPNYECTEFSAENDFKKGEKVSEGLKGEITCHSFKRVRDDNSLNYVIKSVTIGYNTCIFTNA